MDELIATVIYGIMTGSIYCAVALGLVLIFGITDIVNFAHGELVTVGAFGMVLLAPSIGFFPALVVSLALAAVVGAGLYQAAYRFTVGNHIQALTLSLGVLLIFQSVMIRRYTTVPREGPSMEGYVNVFGIVNIATVRLAVAACLFLLAGAFYYALKHTWIGLALRVCGDDQFAASTVGLSARRVGLYAFVVSAVLAAAAGVAIAALFPVTPLTGVGYLLRAFVVVIIGGLGSVGGAVAAAVALGILEAVGATYIDPGLTNVYGFVFMIVVLLVAPQGLFNRSVRRT